MKQSATRTLVALMCVGTTVLAMAQEGEEKAGEAVTKADLPLVVYKNADGAVESAYVPSGWMGNTDALEYDDACKVSPHSGETCIRVGYNDTTKWGGIVWQSPADDWGDEPGGWDLSGAKKLTFWAKGAKGGEQVEFKMGILPKSKPHHDTSSASIGKIKLTQDWKEYEIPLTGKDLRCIKTGFAFSLVGAKEPAAFFLDDIQYE